MLRLTTAIDVCIEALAHIRSFTHPAEVVHSGSLRIMRDLPRKSVRELYRNEEIFSFGASPNEAIAAVREYKPRNRFVLEPFLLSKDDPEAFKQAFKAHGYRLWHTEPFFVCPLNSLPRVKSEWRVRRVATMDEAKRVVKEVFGVPRQKIQPDDLESDRPKVRLYYIEADGKAVALVRSVMLRKNASWVHDLATRAEYRRRGIATALMAAMLQDDARYGSKYSMLLASHTGALLYPKLGYRQVALLQVYNPPKKSQG